MLLMYVFLNKTKVHIKCERKWLQDVVLSVIVLSSVLKSRPEGFMHSETVTKAFCFRPSTRTITCHPCTHTSEKVMGLGPSQTTITTRHYPFMHVLRNARLCTFGLLSVCHLASSYPDESGSWSCAGRRPSASLMGSGGFKQTQPVN